MPFDQRQSYRSAFRNQRAVPKPVKPPAVKPVASPQGAQTRMTVKDQSAALKKKPDAGDDLYEGLPSEARQQLEKGYRAGGFEGIVNAVGPDWYELPEHVRTKILDKARR